MSGGDARERAVGAFVERYGVRPRWGASAPGRVNLIGEHTDYNGGFVLPMAIDRACVAVAGPAENAGESRVYSSELSEEWRLDLRERIALRADGGARVLRGSAFSYVAGVMAGFQERLGKGLPNLDVVIASDVPIGAGLSSSAAIEVSIATLLEQVLEVRLEALEKALLCQRAEHEFAGVPCGLMDQLIAVEGREGHALLIDCRSYEREAIGLPRPQEAAVLVVNSHVRHALADGEYARRRAACAAAARKLGASSLREVEEGDLGVAAEKLDEEELRCVRHVVGENGRVLRAAAALRSGDLVRMGRLMVESHESLRDEYRVSCAELDTLVEALASQRGVHGARMTGGGFGGSVVAIVEAAAVSAVVAEVQQRYTSEHHRQASAMRVLAADGARVLAV